MEILHMGHEAMFLQGLSNDYIVNTHTLYFLPWKRVGTENQENADITISPVEEIYILFY